MIDKVLLRVAKTAILSKFDPRYRIDKEKLVGVYPYLQKNGAAFVTLHHGRDLRGCIGSIIAYRTLLDDIVGNAVSAAFNDPRFAPLNASELAQINLEVSVLTIPEILEYEDFYDLLTKVRPNIDGLILKHGIYQGTFLPQVWEELPSPEEFLQHLSYKAGTNPSIYQEHPMLYRYRVDAIEEKFDEILPI
ncbi:MAG: AmmeMemoRadiSam system protein A [Thiovulaceae bacterium]|nr:AmmeMemoRadiSam system protein A [Sulfurimonadaceae bacterium]